MIIIFKVFFIFLVGPHVRNVTPLLDELIPQSYLVLQDIVQEAAQKCEQLRKKPIFTKKEFLYVIITVVLKM